MNNRKNPSAAAFSAIPWKKRAANYVWPRYSATLDKVNYNALLKKWIKENCGVPILPDRFALYEFVQREYLKGEPICLLEFGVYKGESIFKWAEINVHSNSRFVGFDSFSGLPEDWNSLLRKGAFDVAGAAPKTDDVRIAFVKGLFQDTLRNFLKEFQCDKRLVVHNDSDLYSSTDYCLSELDKVLLPGSIIIFDEFNSVLSEFRAWNDYLRSFMRKAKPIGVTVDYAQQAAFLFE